MNGRWRNLSDRPLPPPHRGLVRPHRALDQYRRRDGRVLALHFQGQHITSWYWRTGDSRIADPADHSRIFSWLICQSHDDKGNVIVYGYKPEDSAGIFDGPAGNPLVKAHERNRGDESRSAQRYLKRIRYGNRTPYLPVPKSGSPWSEPLDASADDGIKAWLFEVVFAPPRPCPTTRACGPHARIRFLPIGLASRSALTGYASVS
ncbi:SpvB/TcaC N-terminal domain-containing protein [Methylomagnum sp.]